MGLWVDPNVEYDGRREMDILVAAGQMTCCYNLMRHIRERFGEGEGNTLPAGSVAQTYYNTLMGFWRQLEQDPWALVDERKRRSPG